MDTKLKNIKYSLFTKFLCWLIAVVVFCLSFTVAARVLIGCYVLGAENYFKGEEISFFDTNPFLTQFQSDFFDAYNLGKRNTEQMQKNAADEKTQVVKDVLGSYLFARGNLIKEELLYAVNNWDVTYYEYEDEVVEGTASTDITNVTSTQVSEQIVDNNLEETESALTLPEDAHKYITVPEYAPKNIKLASYALNTVESPEDFNKYAGLVRESAFDSNGGYGEFIRNVDVVAVNFCFEVDFSTYYTLDEKQAKALFEKQYDEALALKIESDFDIENSISRLNEHKNLKYYVVDFDGEVYSNIKEIPANLSNYNYYVLANGENVTLKGFKLSNVEVNLKKYNVNKLCLYFDEDFTASDTYKNLYNVYKNTLSDNVKVLVAKLAILLLVLVVALIIWLRLIGNRCGKDKHVISFIEKIPNDVHLLLSVGVIVGIIGLYFYLFEPSLFYVDSVFVPNSDFVTATCVFACGCFIIFTEWLASVIRIKKAGESYFKNTLIYKVLCLIKKLVLALVNCLSYKPKAVKLRTGILFALYLLVNFALVFFGVAFAFDLPALSVIFAFLIIAFNIVVGYFVIEYVNTLDKIIVASSEHEDINLNEFNTPRSLKILSNNLSDKNKSIDKAIAEAVKNEQMKTQLITNVSHDLKTPLTSLINYSDLLSKCELNNEDAVKYVEVINQKSDKLKHLIEDLIEASKASTGNVVLNKTKLNLCELAIQAIVEYTPDLEKNFNTIKFNEPAKAPVVFADSIKTYRIISNLLSNVKKYSAPDTRVYVRVFEEGAFGCFEIKNISKEALDINPEQLTERFVRGDESRTNEGNGLGLAIAKDLCNLQDGILDIKIDGDLFKATVKLPLSE